MRKRRESREIKKIGRKAKGQEKIAGSESQGERRRRRRSTFKRNALR